MATWREKKGLWEARRRRPDGRRLSRYGKTEAEAEAKADEAIGVFATRVRDAGTVQEFIRTSVWPKVTKKEESTRIQSKWALDYFILPTIGDLQCKDLQLHHCEKVLDRAEWWDYDIKKDTWTQRKTPRAPDTVKTVRKHLFRVTRLLGRHRLIAYNFLEEIDPPKTTRRKPTLTIKQARQLWESCKDVPPIGAAVFLAAFCGLTRGELLEISSEDIGATLLVSDQAVYSRVKRKRERKTTLKTDNRLREIGLPKEFQAILNGYANGGRYAVHNADGSPPFPTSLRRMLLRECKAAEVPESSMHMLRAAFMTALDDLGCPRRIVHDIVGHADSDVTEGYMGEARFKVMAKWLLKVWKASETSRHPDRAYKSGGTTSSARG